MIKLKLSNQIPLETTEQSIFVQRMNLISRKYNFRYFAVPNGSIHRNTNGKTNYGQIAKLKAEGQKEGVPDLVILKDGKTLFIEMKRLKNSITSPEQTDWNKWLNENKFTADICKGASNAYNVLFKWLNEAF